MLVLVSGCDREPPPNLVLISIDTTRADRLGAYGHERAATPHIDSLAEDGFLFRNHLTPVPITLPSHTSILTGLYPPAHGVRDNGTFVASDDLVTLAEVLSDAGYATGAFVGAFPMTASFGLDQGFDVYDDAVDLQADIDPRLRQETIYFDERPAGMVVDVALEHLEASAGDEPFFAFLHFFDPHQPLLPPRPYDLEFRDDLYDGEIAYVDEQIGRVLDHLEEHGLRESTIVAITADHGEGLGEHGELTHAILLHQATLHVPLILQGPGVPVGETDEWTSSTQVFATLLDLLGVDLPATDDGPASTRPGRSLLPLIAAGGEAPDDWPRFESYFETIAPRTSQGWAQLAAMMKEDWRLVHGPRSELFDLAADPEESTDRSTTDPRIASRLETDLRTFLAESEQSKVSESVQSVDAETLARLTALGYLQGGASSLQSLDDMLEVDGLIDPRDRVIDVSLFSAAKAAMGRKDLPLAERLWSEVLERSPQNVDGYRGMALLALYSGDVDRALEFLDQALTLRADDESLLRLRAEALIAAGQLRDAADQLALLPTNSAGEALRLGRVHQQLGEMEEAKAWYRKGLEMAPRNRWLGLYLANRLAADEEWDEAEATYQQVIDHSPYFALAFYNYASMLVNRGDVEQALPLLERSARLDPDHQPTRDALDRLAPGARS